MAGFDAALRCLRQGAHDLLSPEKINALEMKRGRVDAWK